ncbi:MAG: 50S ribosomal protein L3 [Candidatus Marinimicrobia bacterium]|nr:50S ribosomal protein L3 [Candidatus Neomarinimicrobiota bacterium]
MNFIIGKKVGMTQLFDEDGSSYPVTVIAVEPNIVTQLKTASKDGYSSVQLGFESATQKNKSKAYIGKFKAVDISVKSVLKEFRVNSSIVDLVKVGSKVTVGAFSVGDIVNVSGVSKGKGFAGVMKRHGFGGGRRSHGKNSVMRKPGAIGASADPGRVWPGKAMAGRMGGDNVTVRKLSVLRVDSKLNRLFVNGSIPGANNGVVCIKS